MPIEFLVEERSAHVTLENLLPKILGQKSVHWTVRHFQGKADMLNKLPGRLQGYRIWLSYQDLYIVVLIDSDNEDCHALKARLEAMAQDAGLITKSNAQQGQRFHVLNRLVIEELEAWFLGDVEALRAAYPRVSPNLGQQARYRYPDAIRGGTWEALAQLLQDLNYYPSRFPKIEVARNISQYMDPGRNRSHSFQVFVAGLKAILDCSTILQRKCNES
jgi:translation initiation factor IF-1